MQTSPSRVLRIIAGAILVLAIINMGGIRLPGPLGTLADMAGAVVNLVLNPIVFLPLFAVLWFAIVKRISRRSGWAALAETYTARRSEKLVDVQLRPISGYIGDWKFNRTYRAGATDAGILLDSALLFRPGHPRLLIPWSVVELTERPSPGGTRGLVSHLLGRQLVTLRVTSHPNFEMRIFKSYFDRTGIRELAGGR